ncbi:chloride channel protein 3 [Hortaea werneckii]|nr:chloride channel protein 3 [Hortaea werneckii]
MCGDSGDDTGDVWEYKQGFLSSQSDGTYGLARAGDFEGTAIKWIDPALVPGGEADPEGKRRLVFVGDIHGCKEELLELLKKMHFNTATDHLIPTGDVISKGPDNTGVLDELIRLKAESPRGNHEDRILEAAKALLPTDLDDESLSVTSKGSKKDRKLLKHLKRRHMQYLRDMPLMLRIPALPQVTDSSWRKDNGRITEEIIVVHAGLVPHLPLKKQDPYFVMNMRSIDHITHVPSALHQTRKGKSRPWMQIWNWYNDRLARGRSTKGFHLYTKEQYEAEQDEARQSWLDRIWGVVARSKKTVARPQVAVYGHDSKKGLQLHRWSKGLDSGCVKGGQLTALVLDAQGNTEVVQVECKDRLYILESFDILAWHVEPTSPDGLPNPGFNALLNAGHAPTVTPLYCLAFSSPHQLNGHASSSRSPLSSSASPPEDDDEGAELANGLLDEEDPLHEDGSKLDEGYINHLALPRLYLTRPIRRQTPFSRTSTTLQTQAAISNPPKMPRHQTAIDWIYEYNKERTRLRQLTVNAPGLLGQVKSILDASQIWLVLVATGIAVGSIAAGIDVASDWMGDLKQGVCSNVQDAMLSVTTGVPGARCSASVTVLEAISSSTSPSLYAKQSGIPEIKTVLGGFVIRRFLGAWTLVIKSLGLCLAVASGMWLGKEGPLVHVACCCANVFMKLFAPTTISANEARKREAFSAAAASGISVAFGSPIGGVLFSLEQLSYYFPDKTMWASFVCAMVAAVTLQAFDPFRTGKLVLYQVSYHSGWHAFELVPFALIGILGGLYGAMFIKLNMRIASWRASARNMFVQRPVLEVLIVALATAIISFPITFLRAQSSELVEHLFAECKDIQDDYLGLCRAGIANTGVIFALILSGLLGFLLTTVTFGLQIPAGILLPSMAIGATYGRLHCLLHLRARYTLCHARDLRRHRCGFCSRRCHSDDGLDRGYHVRAYRCPNLRLAYHDSGHAIQGYPFLDNKIDDAVVPDVPVNNIMTRVEDLICITATGHTVSSLQELLQEHQFRQNSHLPSLQLLRLLPPPLADPTITLDLRPWMDQTPITLNSRTSFQLVRDMFEKLGLRYLVFANRGELAGLLTKKDLWYVLNEGDVGGRGYGAGVLREEVEGREDERGRVIRRFSVHSLYIQKCMKEFKRPWAGSSGWCSHVRKSFLRYALRIKGLRGLANMQVPHVYGSAEWRKKCLSRRNGGHRFDWPQNLSPEDPGINPPTSSSPATPPQPSKPLVVAAGAMDS